MHKSLVKIGVQHAEFFQVFVNDFIGNKKTVGEMWRAEICRENKSYPGNSVSSLNHQDGVECSEPVR